MIRRYWAENELLAVPAHFAQADKKAAAKRDHGEEDCVCGRFFASGDTQ